MRLLIDKEVIRENVENARRLTNCGQISIMIKPFYEFLSSHLVGRVGDSWFFNREWRQQEDRCVSFSIGEFKFGHKGAVITDIEQFKSASKDCFIRDYYIPIDMNDGREGLSIDRANKLIEECKKNSKIASFLKFIIMITSGCINDRHPSMDEIEALPTMIPSASYISVGGSFYLQFPELPACVKETRIGEYALFGTIPYCDQVEKFGRPALTVEMDVIEVYPERQHILVRGGYSEIDTKNCFLLSGGLEFVDCSSEYTIYRDRFRQYKVGDIVKAVPDYYSLVKLQHVQKIFT